MANMKYAVGQPFQAQSYLRGDFFNPTSALLNSGAQGGSLATTNPVSNVIDEHLVKTLRCDSWTTDLNIGFDLGASVEPAGVLIENLNFATTISVISATNAALTTSVITEGTPTPVQNKKTGRWSCFADLGSVTARQYWGIRITTTGSAVSGVEHTTGWQVGRITWVDTLSTMSQNWHLPVGQATQYEGAQRVLAGGKMESKASSQGFNVIDLTAQFDRNKGDNIEDDIGAMARTSPEDRYLTWFNRGDVSEAYLCTKIDFSGNLDEFPAISVDMGLREVV